MTRRPWRSAELLDVTIDSLGTSVSFERCADLNAVVSLRAGEIARALQRSLGRHGKAHVSASGTAIRLEYRPRLEAVLPRIHRQIDVIANRPCTPRCVEQLLGIRSIERLRWTQDGRLSVAGSTVVRRGGGITCSLYWAAEIAALAAQPDVIENWRYQDAKRRYLPLAAAAAGIP